MKSFAPFIALLALVLFVPSAAEAAGAPPVPNCSPGGCSGWHNTNVTLTWTIAPGWTNISTCESGPVDSDTADAKRTCTVEYGSTTYSETVTIKRDATPPTASASAERSPGSERLVQRPGEGVRHGFGRALGNRQLQLVVVLRA